MEKTANGRALRKGDIIPGYCYGVEVGDRKDCHKIVDGRCTVYTWPCLKVGFYGDIGCNFSPLESPVSQATKVRIGQQKQRKKK